MNVISQSFFMLSQSSSYDSEATLFECHSTIPQLLAAMPYTTSPFPLRCRVPTYPQQASEDSTFQCPNVRRWLSSGAFPPPVPPMTVQTLLWLTGIPITASVLDISFIERPCSLSSIILRPRLLSPLDLCPNLVRSLKNSIFPPT